MEDNKKKYAVVQLIPDESFQEMFVYNACIRLQSDDEQCAHDALLSFRSNYPDKEFRLLVNA